MGKTIPSPQKIIAYTRCNYCDGKGFKSGTSLSCAVCGGKGQIPIYEERPPK